MIRCSRRMRSTRAATALWFGRSRLSSGSSSNSSRGELIKVRAIRSRCCSPARISPPIGRPRVLGRADELYQLAYPLARPFPPRQGQAEAVAVQAEANDVDTADAGRRVEGVPLRQVADLGPVGAGGAAQDRDRPCTRREQAEQ